MAAPEAYYLTHPTLSISIGPINLDRYCYGCETGPLTPVRGTRDRGQLFEFERCTDILQGWGRSERFRGPIRGSCHTTVLPRIPVADDKIAR